MLSASSYFLDVYKRQRYGLAGSHQRITATVACFGKCIGYRGEIHFGNRTQMDLSLIHIYHHKIKIQLTADEAKITHHFRIELQLLQGVQLIINGRLKDVYKRQV